MTSERKSRDWFFIFSWIALIVVFAALVTYLCLHVEDLLDSDMSSELILAKLLQENGGILSGDWFYSTEIRVVNTQLVYSLFFHLFNDWQTVRIFGNITLYLVLMASYYFLCKRLMIERFFPITAAIMLLPLSSGYFYILLHGAFYLPRISMMFVILGIIIPAVSPPWRSAGVVVSALLSFALGLEGKRMLLVLFIPMALVVAEELFGRYYSYISQTLKEQNQPLKQTAFSWYFIKSVVSCVFAAAGYIANNMVLSRAYSFSRFNDMALRLSLDGIKSTLLNQIHLIGYGDLTYALSGVIWIAVAFLLVSYLFRKETKSAPVTRFMCFSLISWICYFAFSCLFNVGQVAWHMVPVAVLFIPATALSLRERKPASLSRRILSIGLASCVFLSGITGYFEFQNWPRRKDLRTNCEFAQIAATLEEQDYTNGYATFWHANILTELSDGAIEVWCVNTFSEETPREPQLFEWLQKTSHVTERPSGKVFMVLTMEEYVTCDAGSFKYLGDKLYYSEDFLVFDVHQEF